MTNNTASLKQEKSIRIGWRARLLRKLFDFPNAHDVKLPIRHILFINWHGKIGDAIVSSFLYREIRNAFPGIIISVFTTELLKDIYQGYGADYIHIVKHRSPRELYRISQCVGDVDTVVPLMGLLDLHHLFVLWRLRPKNIFGLDDSLQMVNSNFRSAAQQLRIHDIFREILRQLSLTEINDQYILPHASDHYVRPFFDIVFNPYGSRADKSLSQDKSISLIIAINDKYPDAKIGILHSPQTREAAKSIQDLIFRENVVVVCDIKTPLDTLEVLRESSIVISVDTSIVHIAAGLKKKTIAIYHGGKNCSSQWHPRSDAGVYIIYSRPVEESVKKNMNCFENADIVRALKYLLTTEGNLDDTK